MTKTKATVLWIILSLLLLGGVIMICLLLGSTGVQAVSVPAEETALSTQEPEVVSGFPILRWDTSLFRKDACGRMAYADPNVKTLTGIDVSEFQHKIDWKKVKVDGIDFAMIRMGRRGSTAGGIFEDEYFQENIHGALEAGLRVGIYFYSQAVSVEEALEEAECLLTAIKEYPITLPVVYDWEVVGGEEARTYTVPRRTACDCAKAFCDAVAEEGYQPMIYFTRYLAYRKYILRELTDYAFWYAEYEDAPRFSFDFDMWQYTDTGKVDGIEGEIDMNLLFVN